MRRRRVLALLGFGTVALAVPPARAQQRSGVVRIHNGSNTTVTIISLQVDYRGLRNWQPIGDIPARGRRDFPGVPAGAVFGAKGVNGQPQWPPFKIVYPYGPIFEYRLFPEGRGG